MSFDSEGGLYFVHGASVSKCTKTGTVTSLAHNLAVEHASDKVGSGSSTTQLFGIAVDANGNAFVADYGNRRVLKITPDNQMTTLVRTEESWFPTGVAVRGDELYILEHGQTQTNTGIITRVRKLSADGRVILLAAVEDGGMSSVNPPAEGTSSERSSERISGPNQSIFYVLIGAGIVVALTVIVWLVWRRMGARQHGST